MVAELIKKATNKGVWVQIKYLIVDELNLSEDEKLVAAKIRVTEDGDVDLIEIRNGIPELKCYRKKQIEMKDLGEMVGIIIDGSPYDKVEFEKDGEKAKEKYLNIFVAVSDLKEEELKKHSAPEGKYNLPKVGIVPKTAAYLLNK